MNVTHFLIEHQPDRLFLQKSQVGRMRLTGPRLLTFGQVVKEIAEATGKTIVFEQISSEVYSETLRSYQVPEEYIKLLNYLFSEVLDGRNENIQDGVERALNRKPTDFSVFVKRALSSGVWTTTEVKL